MFHFLRNSCAKILKTNAIGYNLQTNNEPHPDKSALIQILVVKYKSLVCICESKSLFADFKSKIIFYISGS